MDRESDEFDRIDRTARVERYRQLLRHYDQGFREVHRLIEDNLYEIGKLDERLEAA